MQRDSVIPKYAKDGDAGLDLVATSVEYDDNGNVTYGTGLSFEIPRGYVGLLFPRSSNSKKTLTLTNSVGVIDSGYRGEVMLKYKPTIKFLESGHSIMNGMDNRIYEVGERVGQIIIIPYPYVELEEADELSETERGVGGYGSTGV